MDDGEGVDSTEGVVVYQLKLPPPLGDEADRDYP